MEKKVKQLVTIIKDRIKDGEYDYLVNQHEKKFSVVHIVDSDDDIDINKEGWNLWIVTNTQERFFALDNCLFIRLLNDEYGYDCHVLTFPEIMKFLEFFLSDGYEINKIE